jgi:hypothetical protein
MNSYVPPVKSGTQNHFKDNQPGVMSIRDIYRAILAIGKDDPNSLIEVSIFSHAFYKGPILVNSMDDGFVLVRGMPPGVPQDERIPLPEGLRDPDDKDGRGFKDFVMPNMTPAEAVMFRAAFNARGYFWVWGCNFPKMINRVLSLVEKHPKYSSSIADDQILTFSNLHRDQIESFVGLNDFFSLDLTQLIRTRKCAIPFRAVKEALFAGTSASYVYQLSSVMRVRAIGALYGTWAEFWGGSPKLMAINGDTLRHVEFYKRHFNYKTDTEGRNYGVFEALPP